MAILSQPGRLRRTLAILVGGLWLCGCAPEAERVEEEPPAGPPATALDVEGDSTRLVYVPVYSHVQYRARRQIELAATLSVRNTDPDRPITLVYVGYYDNAGDLVRDYVSRPTAIGPMASVDFLVEERDRTGGVGANFLVEWTADGPVSAPVIETVMLGTGGAQGVSFITEGRPVERRDPTRATEAPRTP